MGLKIFPVLQSAAYAEPGQFFASAVCNMPTKSKKKSAKPRNENTRSKDLWLMPNYSLKGPTGERAWENRRGGAPTTSRYLELADIALGFRAPTPLKRGTQSRMHETRKTEPYLYD